MVARARPVRRPRPVGLTRQSSRRGRHRAAPPTTTSAERFVVSVDIAALYDEGMGIRSVAEETGQSYSTARRHLLAAGVELRPSGGRPLQADPLAYYLAGLYRRMSLRAIQARTGYGYAFIRTRLRAAGVELRDRQGRPRKAEA
ncbi:helix-turn-helix domain-containing protein [Streptomyces sp. NPDC000987]|uniref:helix-turn-helix domain-containing protein n=1 Tax=Streptomyces sp. NPDC000987 TaxID=3154374 RepID=UPI003317B86B